MYYRGYRIRIYPTKEQKQKILNHINGCRFVWNYMIEQQKKAYSENKSYLSTFDMINLLKPLKMMEEYVWLKNISHSSMQQICMDVNNAYKMFFKKIVPRTPTFKSKKTSKYIYPVRCDKGHIWFEEHFAHIEYLGKVKYKTDYIIPFGSNNKFAQAKISIINDKYFLSFNIVCENQVNDATNCFSMGIDLGIKETAIAYYNSNTYVFHNINNSKQMRNYRKKENYYQKVFARKYNASIKNNHSYIQSNNIKKIKQKISYVRRRMKNIRMNNVHQITHKLIICRPNRIVMEDLQIKKMMKNKSLADKIRSQSFRLIRETMKYKCEMNNILFVVADRFYPSSKTCSCCGAYKQNLKLYDRTYKCDNCGLQIDRDLNAAINLSKYEI